MFYNKIWRCCDEGLKFGLFLPTMRPYNSTRFIDTLLQKISNPALTRKLRNYVKERKLFSSCLLPVVPTIHTVAQESLRIYRYAFETQYYFTGQTVYLPQLSHPCVELDSIFHFKAQVKVQNHNYKNWWPYMVEGTTKLLLLLAPLPYASGIKWKAESFYFEKELSVLRVLYASNPLCKQCQATNTNLSLQPFKIYSISRQPNLSPYVLEHLKLRDPSFLFPAWLQQWQFYIARVHL